MGTLKPLARGLFVMGLALGIGLMALFPARGQEPVHVEQLTISLWPEYDDPRLLVILNGTLNESNVKLRVPLPDAAELHAVAFADEQGNLLNAAWEWGEDAVIVTVPTRQFHVEYYVDAITPGRETLVRVRVPAPDATVAAAVLVVQEPANTTDFRGHPPLGPLEPGADGLRYASRELGALPPGSVVEQEVRYVRLKPGLSVMSVRPTVATTPAADTARPGRVQPGTLLVVAVALLLATGAVAFIGIRRREAGPRLARPLGGAMRRSPAARYCPACGHPFGPQDRYCAMCGTQRPGK